MLVGRTWNMPRSVFLPECPGLQGLRYSPTGATLVPHLKKGYYSRTTSKGLGRLFSRVAWRRRRPTKPVCLQAPLQSPVLCFPGFQMKLLRTSPAVPQLGLG